MRVIGNCIINLLLYRGAAVFGNNSQLAIAIGIVTTARIFAVTYRLTQGLRQTLNNFLVALQRGITSVDVGVGGEVDTVVAQWTRVIRQ